MFTRFGAHLETSMEEAIKQGKILRELLKQHRLSPHSIEFQLAWLIAFNDGLFNDMDSGNLPSILDKLAARVDMSMLHLDSPRGQWQSRLRDWLHVTPGDNP